MGVADASGAEEDEVDWSPVGAEWRNAVWKKGEKEEEVEGRSNRTPPSSNPQLALSKLEKIRKKGKTLA
jgi:hypothetical protein